MKKQELLRQYAALVVQMGVNLQKKQILVINSPLESAEFARAIAAEAYKVGAHDVVIHWGDEQFEHLRYQQGKDEIFHEFPEWKVQFYQGYAEQGAAFVSIAARNPELFQGVAQERMLHAEQAAGAALLEYRARLMSNKNTWCVVSVPTEDWAKKVFPTLRVADAVEALWEKIYEMVRIEAGKDCLTVWKAHIAELARRARFMNEAAFEVLHYTNTLGTDLQISLPKGHIWAGGAEKSTAGTVFVANMPTEEIYTLPKRDGVNGVIVATKPLVYRGNLIRDFKLVFRDGKVVEACAKEGEAALQSLLAVDEGAAYLGEVALVPHDSPISNSGILFYNTLFDENASCHLALGKAYPTCIVGGEDMDSVELLQHGVNDSLIHVDFMIGSGDLSIVGEKADGTEVKIFEHGNFAF